MFCALFFPFMSVVPPLFTATFSQMWGSSGLFPALKQGSLNGTGCRMSGWVVHRVVRAKTDISLGDIQMSISTDLYFLHLSCFYRKEPSHHRLELSSQQLKF